MKSQLLVIQHHVKSFKLIQVIENAIDLVDDM